MVALLEEWVDCPAIPCVVLTLAGLDIHRMMAELIGKYNELQIVVIMLRQYLHSFDLILIMIL
jgi:hypothetical protein